MEIKIKVDDAETMAKLRKISPERFIRAWAKAVKNLAKTRAQEAAAKSGGRSLWQREILPSVHGEVNPASAVVYSDSRIAEHVHAGGVIRARLRKILHGILIFPYAALYYFNVETDQMERDENFVEKMDPVPGRIRGRSCPAGGRLAGRLHLLRAAGRPLLFRNGNVLLENQK